MLLFSHQVVSDSLGLHELQHARGFSIYHHAIFNANYIYLYALCSIVSDSLWHHGLQLTRLLCPRDSLGKNVRVGCHFLLQGIFHTHISHVSCIGRWIPYCYHLLGNLYLIIWLYLIFTHSLVNKYLNCFHFY